MRLSVCVMADIDEKNWGGNGYAFLLLGGARDIVVDHNTIVQEHAQGMVLAEAMRPARRWWRSTVPASATY